MRFLVFILMQTLWAPAVLTAREVTNEDIRDAILSLVQMMRSVEDKLERHEFRERNLGEQLKKGLQVLDKRHGRLDLMRGTLTRLDERVNSVETILIQRNERDRIQLQKTTESIEKIEKSLHTGVSSIEALLLQQNVANSVESSSENSDISKQIEKIESKIIDKLEKIDDNVNSVSDEIETLKNINDLIEESAKKLSSKSVEHLEKTESKLTDHLGKTEKLLIKYDSLLNDIAASSKEKDNNLSDASAQLKEIVTAIKLQDEILVDIKTTTEKEIGLLEGLPKISSKPVATNSLSENITLEAIQELKEELLASSDRGVLKLTKRIGELHEYLNKEIDDLSRSVTDSEQLTETAFGDVSKNFETLRSEVQGLSKVERVMIQTADNVLDTKRRVEYGVHQILLDVGELLKLHTKGLNETVNRRFDDIELTILDNQNGSLSNLTNIIEHEMSQVWRQIGTMHNQLTMSASALERLEAQTELYVNGSLTTMDNMEGKVGKITSRMAEVDENLNYLLGRLSLVTQEFNQIKSGLGTALDNIRSSFLTVQSKIQDVGPGPHKIPKSEDEKSSDLAANEVSPK